MVRLLLVDDQEIIRQGIKSLLESQPDFEVVGEAENGKRAISQVEALHPDMVLMDVRMPLAGWYRRNKSNYSTVSAS